MKRWLTFCALSCALLPACQKVKTGADVQTAYSLNAIPWPKGQPIHVCFENDQPEFSRLVEQALVTEFNAKTAVKFIGFGKCREGERGIHVLFTDAWPRSLLGFKALDGKVGGIKLPQNFATTKVEMLRKPCSASQKSKEDCVKMVALHEFGHAIGLEHENLRPERPEECVTYDEPVGLKALAVFGVYDGKSIMNRCFYRSRAGESLGLSDLDIMGINALYGNNPEILQQASSACHDVGNPYYEYVYFEPVKKCLIRKKKGVTLPTKAVCQEGQTYDEVTKKCVDTD